MKRKNDEYTVGLKIPRLIIGDIEVKDWFIRMEQKIDKLLNENRKNE